MTKNLKIAFIFPGQGAQYPGMGKDFAESFSAARMTLEEADDILKRNLSSIILNGPEATLTETKNSQVALFVTSIAILRCVQEQFDIEPTICSGLSLGEYTALVAGGYIDFQHALPLVQHRGNFMNDACESTKGAMAAILGLEGDIVEEIVKDLRLPNDLWVANYNCPGQVVLSGTPKGIEAGIAATKEKGAKRALPLQVHGAFHSGLMEQAEKRLTPYIEESIFQNGSSSLVMNVPGNFVSDLNQIKRNLIKQVTHSVRWEQGIRAIDQEQIDLFIEIGPGKTLSAMNKRINVRVPTFNVEKIEDLDLLSKGLKECIS